MQSKSFTLLKVLINRFHPGTGESFLHSFPKEEANEILKQTVLSEDVAVAMTWKEDMIARTHYSWLVPLIQQLPEGLQAPMVAALSENQSFKLKRLLKLKPLPTPLLPPVKRFFIERLFLQWNQQEVLPPQYLPPSPLMQLTLLTKEEMVELINFLALHDLAEALRHIVNNKNLKMIYQCLSPKKQQYLRLCLHQKERITAPKLEIEKWNGDPEKFDILLHQRGMFRFGKALSGQDPQFLWHITHILDTGRGTSLNKYCHKEPIPNVTPYLIQQMLFLANFLKKKSNT